MKAIDFLDGADDLGSSQSAESFLDAAEPKKQNKGILGDIGTGLKRGVEQMPGMVTGIADIAAAPVSAITGINRPFSRAADYVGEKTGFQPSKWAEQAAQEYSPEMQQSLKAVEQADGFTGTLKAIGENPRSAVNLIAESLPSTLAGGILARGAMGAVVGAEKLAAMKAAGDTAGLMKAGAIAGGIGEGAVTAGQQMSQTDYNVNPLRAAGSATAAGIGTGIIGGVSGRIANKIGLADIEGSIAAGTLGAGKKAGIGAYAGRIAGGAVQEGALEEMPQSAQEQVWQNVANSKPWDEGVGKASAQGLVAGMAMGAGVNALPGSKRGDVLPADSAAAKDLNQSLGGDVAATPTLVTDIDPMHADLINRIIGVGAGPMDDKQRAQYEKDLAFALDPASPSETVGYTTDANGIEIPFTMRDYVASTVRVADMTRDQPKAARANILSADRLAELGAEESTQQPDITPGYVPPAIPVVGPLSAVANMAVQSGAHQATVMQQAAAQAAKNTPPEGKAGTPAGAQNVATAPAQGPLTEVAGQAPNVATSAPNVATPASAFDVSGKNILQLKHLAAKGQPGWKEAATAELVRLNGSISESVPALNAGNSVNLPATSISSLQDQLDKTEPFSEQSQLLTERLQLAVTDDAKSAIGAGEMPVYKVTDHVSVAIHPSAQKEGMIQVTRYTKDGVIGDSQYNSIDEAVRFEGLTHKPRIPSNEAIAHIENSIAAEAEYQKRKNEQQAGAGLPAPTAGGSRPAPVANQEPIKNQSEQPLDMVPAVDAVSQPKTDAAPEAKQDNAPVSTLQPDPALQNRDRGRAASVNQMQSIARNPDYMRLGPSRTPDSGAPMVFAVGNDTQKISPANFGANDTAVMSDGQRVPFRYAVVDASQVQPSNFADGATNPAFASNAPGTIKALNNGRTAGVRSAHSSGNAATYTAELLADNAHGVSPEAIRNTPNPMLVRVYAEQSNTGDMAAKSQGHGLGMSASERATQDAELMTGDVLDKFAPGDIASAGNRDFVRAFVGKLAENELADMMDATGNLSQDGRRRIEAALLTAAYGKSDLVQELFESTDTDIKAIGNALKVMSGQWVAMRQAAKEGSIDPATDMTANLIEAVNIVRRSRAEGSSIAELAGQGDLMGGNYLSELSEGFLRIFYKGKNYDRARGGDKVIAALQEIVTSAMNTKAEAGLFGDSFKETPKQIVESARSKIDEENKPASQSSLFGANGQATAVSQGNRSESAQKPGEVGSRPVGTGRGEETGKQAEPVAKAAEQAPAVNAKGNDSDSLSREMAGFTGVSDAEYALRQLSHKEKQEGDIELGNGKFVTLEQAVEAAKKSMDPADWSKPFQFNRVLDIAPIDWNTMVGAMKNATVDAKKQEEAKPSANEPWQMTRKEWYDAKNNDRAETFGSSGKRNGAAETAARIERKARLNYGVAENGEPVDHRQVIEKAIADGKQIPDEVLADYPDLKESGIALLSPSLGRVDANKVDIAVASKVVADLLSGWRNAPDSRVVATFDDLPAAVRKEIEDQGEKTARGVFHGDTFYLIADEHASANEIEETIFHEVWAHYGLRSMLGANTTRELAGVFDQISASGIMGVNGKDAFRAFARRNGFNTAQTESMLRKAEAFDPRFTEAMKKRILVEELIAKVQEKGDSPSLKRKAQEIIGAIREWLRKVGFSGLMKYSDADLMRLVQKARDTVKYGKRGSSGKGDVPSVLMTAWHGSPHDHDKFDSSKIGTGEGAQAYGHGLYFAGERSVAEYYRNAGSSAARLALDALNRSGGIAKEAIKELKKWDGGRNQSDFLDAISLLKTGNQNGRLYQVELAPSEDEYLDWDKPLSEQSDTVKAALDKVGLPKKYHSENKTGSEIYRLLSQDSASHITGKLMDGRGDKAASEYLHSLGIRGIRYLDGSSRSKGEGNSNYVIFSDDDVTITAKYNLADKSNLSPADKAIYGMAAEGKSAAEVLKFIASASRSPFNRQVARLLLKTGIAPSITVGDGKGWKMNAGDGNKYAAAYNPKTDTVSLFRPASAERNMLHELIHAATLKALSKKGMASAQMNALYTHVKKSGKLKGMYGMSDVDEFIAEAFSNPKFQAMLKQVSAAPVGGKPSSEWDWFIRVVRGILGLKQGADNALSQALDIGVGVMRENMALQSGDGVIRFNHALRSNPEGNRPLNAIRLANLRRIAAGLERPKDAVFLRVTEDGKAITTGPKGVRIPETFIRFAESNGLDFEARRNGESRKSDGHTVGDHITSKTEPMPEEYRESGALYFGEGNEFFDRTGKTRYNAAPGKINQTDTAAFRRWFGDSKVVDADGKPLRVYHGTGATDIGAFNVSDRGSYGGGIYLTPEIRGANDYAIYRGAPSSTVYPVYAAIKNPASGSEAAQVASWKGEENAREELIRRGYDGVVDMRSGEIVAFYPSQVKSAIGNNGNFDASNPDIRYNVADEGKINQTDTAAFKRWFGDSKVVDSDGNPLVVYHGTKNDFTSFNPDSHFGTKDQADSILAEARGKVGKRVMPVYLSAQKMKRVKDQEIAQRWSDVVATAKRQGYDGLIYKNEFEGDGTQDSYVVFKPEQIKSAIGNSGDFDATNPDIRYNVADEGWSVSEQAKETVMRLAGRPMLDPSDPFAAENARLREQDQSLWSKAKKQLRRYLAPGGLLPQSVFAEKIKRDSEFQAVEFDVRHLIGGLEHAVKADFGIAFDKLSKEQMRPITEALAGNVPASLPEATKTAAVAMRQYIDGMSTEYLKIIQQKIDAKMLKAIESGKDSDKAQAINEIELFEKIKGNIGRYVHRSYQAFDDPKWFEKVPASVLNASRLYLKQGYMEAGEADAKAAQMAEVTLHEILKNGTAYDSMESFIAESKLGAKDLSVLMRRKEVPAQIRALLGEYPDARLNFTKSATKMGRLIWNTRFLDRVRDMGMGSFFFEGKDRPPNATTQIAADGSEVYAPLNGLWTFPETAQAFKDALGKEQMSDLYRAIVRANGLVKYGKTVLAPTTAMRNWQSAMFFSLANGHFDLTQMKKSISAFREQVSQKATGQDLKYLRHLKQLGVVYDTPYAGEMARLMEDARMEELLSSDKGDAVRLFRKANQLAQGFYTFGDDFWKIIGFENEKAGLMKAGLSLQEAETEAAKRIRDTYPTYSMVGRGVKWLSRFPLAGTFVSFPAEIIRTSGNMLRTVAADLKSDNPKLRELGMKRAAGMVFVSAAFYSLAALSMAMAGVGDDEDEAIRDLAPEWQKNSTFLYLGRDEKGNLRYFDTSFLDPYGYWKRPITAMLRNQPWEDSLASGLRGMLEPFIGADIAAKAIFEAVANQKESGGKVYKEKDGAINQTIDVADHLRKALQPGVAGNVERLVKAAGDVRKSSGQPYSMEDELVALVGWRATTIDPKTALYYRSFEFTDAVAEARKTITETLRDANEITPEDIADAKARAQAKQEQAFKEMHRLVSAAESAGMSKMQIVQTLRLSNISQANIGSLMRGEAPDVSITPQLAARAVRQASQMRGPEFAADVFDRYRQAMAK